MMMPTLFKRTSAGAVQVWCREIEGDKYRSVSGQLDGAQVAAEWTVATPKNVGRSNATTGEQQAQIECDAAYVKKLAQGGYHESIDDIDKPKFFKPMLAQDHAKYKGDIFAGDVYAQPKLDGVRCIATADGLWTRQGKPIDTCPHVMTALTPHFEADPDLIFDGELYADSLSDNFNEIISLIRKKNPTATHLALTAANIQYHMYDLPSSGEADFASRHQDLFNTVSQNLRTNSIALALVRTTKVFDQDMLDQLNEQWIAEGYEGQMIRLPGPYKNGRSNTLLKRKEFDDEEFTVVEVVEGVGNRSGKAGYITYRLPDGRTFGSGIRGTHEYCTDLLKNADKYVDGTGTVRFFGYTPDGVPRFPVTVTVYEGDRDA